MAIADARRLPFGDQAFDTVLALQSTYRIKNDNERAEAFAEMMRVGNVVHVGPIFGRDFSAITQRIAPEMGYEVVVCHPFRSDNSLRFGGLFAPKEDFKASRNGDYGEYVDNYPYEERVIPPKWDTVITYPSDGSFSDTNIVRSDGGSFMVLKRKN